MTTKWLTTDQKSVGAVNDEVAKAIYELAAQVGRVADAIRNGKRVEVRFDPSITSPHGELRVTGDLNTYEQNA